MNAIFGKLIIDIVTLYNKMFEDKLPPVIRVTTYRLLSVYYCVGLYGRESVDKVFTQVLSEPFMLGCNKTGFIASFDFIFEPHIYKRLLDSYKKEQMLKKGGDQ